MHKFLFGSFLGIVTLTGFAVTHSYFSDQAASTSNTFTAAAEFPTQIPTSAPTSIPTPTLHLVINEVFEASTNDNEWVEIFNPTSSDVNLNGWTVSDALSSDPLPTGFLLPAGGYGVIVTNNTIVTPPGSSITLQLNNATIGDGLTGTGDLVSISDGSSNVDEVSYGDNTSIFTLPEPNPTQSLSRIPNGQDTDSASDWQLDDSPTLGTANSL